jgi:spermidine synthase
MRQHRIGKQPCLFDHCGLAQMGWNYLLLMCSDQPIVAHHPFIAEQDAQLASYLRDDHDIDPASLPYLLLHRNVAALRKPGGAPLNTLDRPVLEFEMARLKARGLEELQQRIVDSMDPIELANAYKQLDGGLEPMLKAALPILGGSPYNNALHSQLRAAQGQYRLAIAAEQAGDCDGVIEHMPAAAVLSTRLRLLHLSLGRCYEIKGRLSEALAAYRREREADPGNAQLALVLGRVLVRLERYEEALAELRRAQQQDHSGAYFFMLGATHQGLGEREEARMYFSKAKQITGSLKAASNAALLITGQRPSERPPL